MSRAAERERRTRSCWSWWGVSYQCADQPGVRGGNTAGLELGERRGRQCRPWAGWIAARDAGGGSRQGRAASPEGPGEAAQTRWFGSEPATWAWDSQNRWAAGGVAASSSPAPCRSHRDVPAVRPAPRGEPFSGPQLAHRDPWVSLGQDWR